MPGFPRGADREPLTLSQERSRPRRPRPRAVAWIILGLWLLAVICVGVRIAVMFG